MAFLTTKTIKGRPYLYVQWSWREGGKVKTDGRYIAPVDPDTGEIHLPEGKTPQEVYAQTRESFLNGRDVVPPLDGDAALSRQSRKPPPEKMPPIPAKLNLAKPSSRRTAKPDQKRTAKPAFRGKSELSLRVNLKFAKLGISKYSLEQRHRKHEQILNGAKLNANTAPRIIMRHGLRHKVRYFAPQNVIAVSVGRFGKGTANRARANFGRALAEAKLKTLEAQSLDAFKALTLHTQSHQKQTRIALRKYLYSTNGRERFTKALAVKMFGTISPLRISRNKRLPASHLGLSEYGNRSDWREDTVLLLMEVERHKEGYRGALNETKAELGKAKASLRYANKQGFSIAKLAKGKRMSWGFRRRREVRRAEARVTLQQIRLERLNGLREVFRF